MPKAFRKITAIFWIPVEEWPDNADLGKDEVRSLARLAQQGAAELAYTQNELLSAAEAQENEDWSERAQGRFFWEEEEE